MVLEVWVEKYRPRRLDDIVGQEEVVARLKEFVRTKKVPHMLFYGPPGTGKTTAALALAYELYGENWRANVLELNASDERGINVIRERVKNFARTAPSGPVPFKLIILDEADNMTSDAQQALRRLMEMYAANARFILIANYVSKIIDPIQSRCAIFKFKPLSKEAVIKRLKYIAEKEGVKITEDAFEALWEISQGDLRKAINTLQAAASMGGVVTADIIYELAGKIRHVELEELVKKAVTGDFFGAREVLRKLMLEKGASGLDILRLLMEEIIVKGKDLGIGLNDEIKAEIAELAGEVDFRLTEGADEDIQMNAFIAKLAAIGRKYGLAPGRVRTTTTTTRRVGRGYR